MMNLNFGILVVLGILGLSLDAIAYEITYGTPGGCANTSTLKVKCDSATLGLPDPQPGVPKTCTGASSAADNHYFTVSVPVKWCWTGGETKVAGLIDGKEYACSPAGLGVNDPAPNSPKSCSYQGTVLAHDFGKFKHGSSPLPSPSTPPVCKTPRVPVGIEQITASNTINSIHTLRQACPGRYSCAAGNFPGFTKDNNAKAGKPFCFKNVATQSNKLADEGSTFDLPYNSDDPKNCTCTSY